MPTAELSVIAPLILGAACAMIGILPLALLVIALAARAVSQRRASGTLTDPAPPTRARSESQRPCRVLALLCGVERVERVEVRGRGRGSSSTYAVRCRSPRPRRWPLPHRISSPEFRTGSSGRGAVAFRVAHTPSSPDHARTDPTW
ncbi:hypothetical protein [Nocardia otitidiscaviarum]|uniref:hypothetical protein n=1 Tax=Nocardia otitidiscaviarum TaxID=1823 RepID=UPI002458754A|nr:hypothetical protein [Nocardia otitidiscaviarum]